MKLTAENVRTVFMDCLFNDGEDTSNHVAAEGIITNVGFHPGRLESHTRDIGDMLSELPDSFMANGGGGMSFLNACMTKDDVQWGEHQQMEQLFQLGQAVGFVKSLMPREMWGALPGGMPYYSVEVPQPATSPG